MFHGKTGPVNSWRRSLNQNAGYREAARDFAVGKYMQPPSRNRYTSLTASALSSTLLSLASRGRSLAAYGLPAKAKKSQRLTVPFPVWSNRLVARDACSFDIPSNTFSCRSPSSRSAVEMLPVPSFGCAARIHRIEQPSQSRAGNPCFGWFRMLTSDGSFGAEWVRGWASVH